MNNLEQENIPRPEYPRPQFKREDNWINLNGEWDFSFDDLNIGLMERWYKKEKAQKFKKKINVPFCFQSKLSGIEDNSFHEIIWYRREFKISKEFQEKKVILHLGAVDYSCIVYVNGEYIGSHEGGYIGFSLDITDSIEDSNVLVVRVEDPNEDLEIPRGKQYWKRDVEDIFYPRISGIWQTVWLEFIASEYYLEKLKITSDIKKSLVFIEVKINGIGFSDLSLLTKILFNGQDIARSELKLDFLGKVGHKKGMKIMKEKIGMFHKKYFYEHPNRFEFKISIPETLVYLWDGENPNLYNLHLEIYDKKTGEIYDNVKSYFGIRKISISDGLTERNKNQNRQILLNDKPIYQKLLLVQGYWPESLYTAPSDDAIKKDIQFVKEFGFNGLRTHQKAFDPRFLYWCDKMGVLVWGEIGNAFRFSPRSQLKLINEFVAEIERDYNHPSIICWVPLNEGWGVSGVEKVPKRAYYIASLYYLVKSIDPTRIVIDNDGWWHAENIDVFTRHFYFPLDLLPKNLEDEKNSHEQAVPKLYLDPHKYRDEPIIYSEIGGYGYDLHENIEDKWGYGDLVESGDDLYKKVLDLLKEFDKRKQWVHGFCYTELYDQFQEINGLLTFDREPKFPPYKLKEQLENMFY